MERQEGVFKMHIAVDLDTRRILAFAVSDVNGGEAAHLSILLNRIIKQHTDEGIPLKGSIADLVMDRMPRAGSRAGPNQTLLGRWTVGDGTPDAEEMVPNESELSRWIAYWAKS